MQQHVYDVKVLRLPRINTVSDIADLFAALNHSLTKQKSRRQFKVPAGGAHGDRQGLVAVTVTVQGRHPDLQRLLHRQLVDFLYPTGTIHYLDF